MEKLTALKCVPCRGDEEPLDESQIQEYQKQVPEWQVNYVDEVPRLERTFKFPDFQSALEFTNQVGEYAEEEDHHPLLTLTWGRVEVAWWTHAIEGLHKNDFIMAAKTDQLAA